MPGKMAKSAPRPAFGLPEGPKICLTRKTSRKPSRTRWLPADQEIIVKALKRTEERITHVINTGDDAERSGGDVVDKEGKC
jgi:hypothetical protein